MYIRVSEKIFDHSNQGHKTHVPLIEPLVPLLGVDIFHFVKDWSRGKQFK